MFEARQGPNGTSPGAPQGVPAPSPGEKHEYAFVLPPDEEGMVYQCHQCSYNGTSRFHFNAHVNTHYEFQCLKCDFDCKEEVTYVKHLKDEHNCTPEDLEEAEVRAPRVNSQGKVKTFKCKQCEFVAVTKEEFWRHGRGHIKPEKLLCCPKCIFVTEYKHHLEYHLRNHYGSKPFKCSHCNYSCVNKSMLNSHMKSHTNVYQYRCQDCQYATKYCHSLKLHLRKYGHKPAMVLNNDGTPNPLPIIDVFGNRRGPKSKKGEEGAPAGFSSILPQFPSQLPPPLMAQMQLQQLQQQFGGGVSPPKSVGSPFHQQERKPAGGAHSPPFMMGEQEQQLRCDKCSFVTSSREIFKNHLLLHASTEHSALHTLLTAPLPPPRHQQDLLNRSHEELSPRNGAYSPRVRSASPASPRHFGKPLAERPESPSSSLPHPPPLPPHLTYLNKLTMGGHPLLQGLAPNPTIKALMEHRGAFSGSSLETSPEPQGPVMSDSPASKESREEAPLPPNKRIRADIFSALYASKMSEIKEGKSTPEHPGVVLDLSKEPVGGASHGSSSDQDTGSNPRSHSSSPALSAGGVVAHTTKNRRKGKAFKIERRVESEEDAVSTSDSPLAMMPRLLPLPRVPRHVSADVSPGQDRPWPGTACKYCGIAFQNTVMYTIHMGYHGFQDPFKCNMCGEETADSLSFFLHIARREHQ